MIGGRRDRCDHCIGATSPEACREFSPYCLASGTAVVPTDKYIILRMKGEL